MTLKLVGVSWSPFRRRKEARDLFELSQSGDSSCLSAPCSASPSTPTGCVFGAQRETLPENWSRETDKVLQ